MTNDITLFDENETQTEETAAPPLCLVHYFGTEAVYPPERPPKPPGAGIVGRIAEREGNLIFLEFAPPPKRKAVKPGSKKDSTQIADALFLLLLLTCLVGCVAAFRF